MTKEGEKGPHGCSSSLEDEEQRPLTQAQDQEGHMGIVKGWGVFIKGVKLPISFYFFIILLFVGCFILLPKLDGITPTYLSTQLQNWTLFASRKPLPSSSPPGKFTMAPSQIQNSTPISEPSTTSPLPIPPSIGSTTGPSQIHNSTQTPELWTNSTQPSTLPINSPIVPSPIEISTQTSELSTEPPPSSPPPKPNPEEYPLTCTINDTNQQTCPTNYPTNHTPTDPSTPLTCPDYFRWIHEDLRPWKETGITREMVEGARRRAHFRLVIIGGRVYVKNYRKSIQTRDKFTLWGFLQLLRWYPGRLPDLELMFDCNDRPGIRGPKSGPPPLFRYCSDAHSLDILFPDWSFWGWAETNVKPWRESSRDIQEGNKRIKWEDRVPYAFWRGNPFVAPWRRDLLKCNVSEQFDWNTRLYVQDWIKQSQEGYKESNLADQCIHRYKIYIEGWAWSVSQKYIHGCDSMTLVVRPRYHEFFSRGMLPLVHYWPIRDKSKCTSLKFAVEWGNNHTDKAQEIGQEGSRYIHEDMRMELVYDYMFHILTEYANLLRFKPEIPPRAVELCTGKMACQEEGIWRKFMEESLEKSPSDRVPCNLPPPYDPLVLRDFVEKKNNLVRQVEMWEDEYWAKLKP